MEFDPPGVTNFSNGRTFSRSRPAQEIGPHSSSQQTKLLAGSLPTCTSGREKSALHVQSSSNLQSLTRGAASFLAARKLSSSHSNSNTCTVTSHFPKGGMDTNASPSATTTEKIPSSNSEALLVDDLPPDFDDFSDENNDSMTLCADVQTLLHGQDRGDAAHAGLRVACEKVDTSDADLNSGKTASKESSFFNRLCEGV